MNQEQSIRNSAVADRGQIRVRFDQLKRSRQLSPIGLPELIGLGCAVFLALLTVFLYFYLLVPARSRVRSLELDRDRLQGQLRAAREGLAGNTSAGELVKTITASIDDFESNWLVAPSSGRMSLYADLNDLIRSNGLRNTAGPSYTTLPSIGTKTQQQVLASADKQSTAKWQSVYPGIAVSVTVEGPYQNVRHFVHDIETSRQFLVINAVELETVTETSTTAAPTLEETRPPIRGARPPAGVSPGRSGAVTFPPPAPGTRGALVSLRLEMATYFRRAVSESSTSTP